MRSSLAWSLSAAFGATAVASVMRPPQQTDDVCCFGLASLGLNRNAPVTEASDGQLILGGASSQAALCLGPSDNTISDEQGHNCSIGGITRQFHCLAGSSRATSFDLLPGTVQGEPFLMWGPYTRFEDHKENFWACPTGPGDDPNYNIYAGDKFDVGSPDAGCLLTGLVLTKPTSSCKHSHNKTSHSIPRSPREGSETGETSSIMPSVKASPLTACVLSDSSPSISPMAISIYDAGQKDHYLDSSTHHVDITPKNYSVLAFRLSREFLEPHPMSNQSVDQSAQSSDHQRTRCALEFRMPTCSQLPQGYPCYRFSGIEQEVLAHSGMNFNFTFRQTDFFDSSYRSEWNSSTLHQVFPGDTTAIGTFDCTIAPETDGLWGLVGFTVSSVRDFSLSFEQAGGGYNFTDGIGFWVRRCL